MQSDYLIPRNERSKAVSKFWKRKACEVWRQGTNRYGQGVDADWWVGKCNLTRYMG